MDDATDAQHKLAAEDFVATNWAGQAVTHAGIVFFQARNVNVDFSILNSDSSSIIEGTIYLLHLNSDGHISDNSPWTAIIAKTIPILF